MDNMKRTDYCGTLTEADCGREVVVAGFTQRQRDLGQLIFIDLRDRSGIVQLAFDDKTDREIFDKAFTVRSEFILMAKGTVRERSSKNPEIPTGNIEIEVTELKILGQAQTPPFEILDDTGAKEDLRLKYRYLDLRRPALQKNILMRHKIAKVTRDYFDENGFIEIETPTLIKSTPEGARDYLVPSRVHPGSFFALPQSPQMYKQLLMVSGFDRYMQIARCYRDEDLRADRQPEFTQIDLEMSFVDMEDVLAIGEGFMKRLFREVLGIELDTLPRLTYTEAMEQYGSDKPDTRYDMKICDLSDIVKDCGFGVFSGAIENGGTVRAINAKNAAETLTRKEIDKLTEYVRGIGAKGLAFIRWVEDEPACSFSKFMTAEEMAAIYERTGAEKGDVILIVADRKKTVLSVLGSLRGVVARKLDIIPDTYNPLWITEFPFFEYNEETGNWDAMHHPFTSPLDECIPYLDGNPEKVFAKAYDLVLNGVELASGSIRITDPELQGKMFRALGLSDEEAHEKFGFLTDAFKYGAPPHGGMGIGLDRLCMTMLGLDSIRDVTAFPKVATSSELMSGAPAPVDDEQLRELAISIIKPME
ncbi:MAG: aspartate--tRNA ligase [Clostridia bacterium]|nr:aspartate--tRNA ligase [Oscillospiraceae bacterium]MBR6693679.1 aspartate--tRNA ligase [Clostridia bacterium]